MTSHPMLPSAVSDIIYQDSQTVNECSHTLFIYACFEYMKLYCLFTWIYI